MRMRNVTVIVVSLAAPTGCMQGQKQVNRQQPAGAAEVDSNVARATVPPEAEHPLNHVERADKLIGEEVLTSSPGQASFQSARKVSEILGMKVVNNAHQDVFHAALHSARRV